MKSSSVYTYVCVHVELYESLIEIIVADSFAGNCGSSDGSDG